MTETVAAPAPAAPAAVAPVAPAPEAAPATVLGTEKPAAPAVTAPADYKLAAPTGTGLDDKRVGELAGMVGKWAESHADKGVTPAIAALLLETQIEAAKAEAARNKSWADSLKASRTPDVLHADDVAVTNYVRTNFGEAVVKLLMDSGHIANPDIFNGFARLAAAGREKPMVNGGTPTNATVSPGKANFPRSPINWTAAERAEWEAAGCPQL